MRVLFILILLANLWAYALGQGILGMRPEDEGRDARKASQQLNDSAITLTSRPSTARQ